MDVPFCEGARVEVFTAGIDVGEHLHFVLFVHQRRCNLIIGRDHAALPAIEIGNDDHIPFAGQPSTEIFHLSGQPPPVVEEHQAGIDTVDLWPEQQTVDLVFFRHPSSEIGIDHLVGVCGNRHAAGKSRGAGPDLLHGKRGGLCSGHRIDYREAFAGMSTTPLSTEDPELMAYGLWPVVGNRSGE